MRLALTAVWPATRHCINVILEADGATEAGEIAAGLAGLAGGAADSPRYAVGAGMTPGAAAGTALFVDGRPVSPRLALAGSPIRPGCVVNLGDPSGCPPGEPAGIVEVRVAGGPAAGMVYGLGFGQAGIGSGPRADISLADPELAGSALLLSVDAGGEVTVCPLPGTAVLLDRRPVSGPATWTPGAQLAVGSSLLELARYQPPDAALQRSGDGAGLDFNRPPRLLPPRRQTQFRLPAAPGKPDRRPLPVLMAVLPAVLGVGMWLMTRSPYMLMITALSPAMMIGQYVTDKRQGRESHAQQVAGYLDRKARIERDAAAALAAEQVLRRTGCPDPATVAAIASGPRRRLWERRRTDPDYLLLRVGTADLPSAVVLEDPARDDHNRQVHWQVLDAPVTVPLAGRGVLGVAGPAEAPRAIGRWLVAQAAVLHSPNDLQLCILTDATGEACWDWVRWLPHTVPAAGQNASTLIGNDAETVAARIGELRQIVAARQEAARNSPGNVSFAPADTIVVLDGSRRLRSMPGVIQLLREGPAAGVYAICLDSEERFLPAECQAVAVAGPGGLRVQQMSEPVIHGAHPDHLAPGLCARLARAISPVRDVSDTEDSIGLPDSSRLLDVLDFDPPGPEELVSRWRRGGQATFAVLGESYDGPFGIDIRADGPHGLVAGTTGAGKSELLQTIVASLAVANRPDAMTFVLVDYKGGSAFRDCVHLPHTVGMVTDLDTHLVERALESLGAELTRREHLLAGAGAKDIEDYATARSRGAPLAAMPRLLLVIDEFASMVRDLPDFITGLVNIAQRGRSLGIHLILATQRPSGVVTADIRANTNLRIALRVTDPEESTDVIGAPDAARISKSTPGRAYVRLGPASLVPFQAARVGGRRPGTAGPARRPPWLARLEWDQLGRRPAGPPPPPQAAEEEITDLKILVEAVRGANEKLGLPRQHRPWLPPLPESILLAGLPAAGHPGAGDTGGGAAAAGQDGHLLPLIPYAVDDLPSQQARRAAVIDLASFGHTLAAGAPRSGRSQYLRTIAGSAASRVNRADLHIYGIDCGNGALLALTALPHCGAVVTRTEAERATRLIRRLRQELARRQDLLPAGGFASITEQRAAAPAGERLPHLLVLVDRWEGFTTSLGELHHGELHDTIQQMLAEGASAGIHLIITGDHKLLGGRISAATEDKIGFRLTDKAEFASIGVSGRKVPDDMPPGRALRNETGVETQVALLAPDASGPGQAAALAAIGEQAAARDAGLARPRPFRVDVLPGRITFADAWQLRDPAMAGRPLFGLAGVGGDELTGVGPDLATGVAAFTIAGPMRSGRSTALVSMARSFLAAGTQAVLVTPRPSPLRDLTGQPGVVASFESAAIPAADLSTAVDTFTGPGVVLIDDAEITKECEAGEQLAEIVAFGADRQRAVVCAGSSDALFTGFATWLLEARKARRGLLLSPQDFTDGDLVGVLLPRDLTGGPIQPGRGFLHLGGGKAITVQVPSG